ncbi:MAG: hypothetical protein JNM56_03205 [Planctomycetia bacterium]|nr:hypothetical protein [Planctomycetia bacterium]
MRHTWNAATHAATFLIMTLACAGGRAEELQPFLEAKQVKNLKLTLNKAGRPDTVKCSDVTDEVLERIGRETTITSLEVGGTFTDKGVAHLANLTKLRKLMLFGAITSEWGVPLKGKLPELEELTMSGGQDVDGKKTFLFSRTSGDAFRYIADFPNLKKFNPGTHHVYYFNNEAIRHLATPTMEVIKMAGSTAGEKKLDYSPLARCAALKELQIPQATDNDSLGQYLPKLTNLQKLRLYVCTDAIIPSVLQVKGLEYLEGRSCQFSADKIKQLAALPNLSSINLSAPLDRDQLLALKEIKSLKAAQVTARDQASIDALKAARPDLKLVATINAGEKKAK